MEAGRAFRTMTSTLDLRPVYHRLDDRIRAHVLLCWLALLLVRVAERRPRRPGRPSTANWVGSTRSPSPGRPDDCSRPAGSPTPRPGSHRRWGAAATKDDRPATRRIAADQRKHRPETWAHTPPALYNHRRSSTHEFKPDVCLSTCETWVNTRHALFHRIGTLRVDLQWSTCDEA
jgi:Transposase